MKIIKGFLLVMALCLVIYGLESRGLIAALPWWKVTVVALITGVWMKAAAWRSFIFGFLAIAIWWGLFAALASQANGGVLATRMGQLFNGISPMLLLLITALVGGLAGGLGAMLGAHTRGLFPASD